MQPRGEPSRALLRLAAAQEEVVTREQALGLGLSRHTLARLVSQGQWQRLAAGLFVTHSTTPSWASVAWGGVLIGGDGARLGGSAAGFAHRLVDDAPDPVEVLVPHDARVRCRPRRVFTRERPGARSPRTTGSPPRILAADCVLDLCDGASPRTVEDWVTRAVQRRLTTPQQLLRALAGRSHHSCRVLLTELLMDVDWVRSHRSSCATCATSSDRTRCLGVPGNVRARTVPPCATCSTRSTPSSSSSTDAVGTKVRAGSGTCGGTTPHCSPGYPPCVTGSATSLEARARWAGRSRSC